ncbi:MAG: ABC transporter permease [Lachnospiraceae bacterium]|nr:ABC transporter permease [Lachnospiraceae bacterium]
MNHWIKELWLAMGQTLRLLFAGKQALVLMAAGLFLLTGMLVCMDEVKEEKSRISIGMADEENSSFSQTVLEGMKQIDLYEVTTGTEKELVNLLQQGELSAVCVIREDFSESVAKGDVEQLITIYETGDGSAMLVGDILAGVMMQEICTAKSYQMLLKYEKKAGREEVPSLEEYRTRVEAVLAEGGSAFAFEVTYLSSEREEVKKPAQSLIYEQAIFAVFAMMTGLLAVYAVLPFRQMCHGKTAEKIKTLPIHSSALYAGSALGAFVLPAVFGCVFLFCYIMRNPIEVSQIFPLLICTAVYICVIVCMILLAAYGMKSQTVYQMGTLAMLLIFGILGLVSLADGLLLPEGTVTWVPNGWYVRRMTELINQR